MRRRAAILAAACGLVAPVAACAERPPPEASAITVAVGPCNGACPTYRVTVNADGSARFIGQRGTRALGARDFTIAPDAFQAFAARLEPIRPRRGARRLADPGVCDRFTSDRPTTEVTWTGGGEEQSLTYNGGCDPERHQDIVEALDQAGRMLPIGDMAGGAVR